MKEWKLHPVVFNAVALKLGRPDVDLFPSRLTHQVTRYLSWREDPNSWAMDALQQPWTNMILYAFPTFNLIGRVLRKLQKERVCATLIAPIWQSQPWYPLLLRMLIMDPILLPQSPELLTNPQGEIHPMLQNHSLRLAA